MPFERCESLGSCAIRPTAAVAHGTSPGAKPSHWGFPMHTSDRSVSPPCSELVSPTSRTAAVRTRMPGGVGGAEPRGSPLSRSLAHRVDSLRCEGSDAIGAKRTCRERRERVDLTKNDPSATLAVRCGNGFDGRFQPLSKYSFEPIQCCPLSL